MKINNITLNISQLVYDNEHNPFHNRNADDFKQYMVEWNYFSIKQKPIVFKSGLWEGDYLVLSNVADVIIAKNNGDPVVDVLELTEITQEEAERFSFHRNYFLSLSEESKYLQLKKIFNALKSNTSWADSIKVENNKIWDKVSKVSHYATGSISKLMMIGSKDFSLLKKIDDGIISKEAAYRQVNPKNESFNELEDEDLPNYKQRKSRPRSIPINRNETRGSLPMPADNFEFVLYAEHTKFNQPVGTLYINDRKIQGRFTHEDLGAGFSALKFESSDGVEITIRGFELKGIINEAGFTDEPPKGRKKPTDIVNPKVR